MATAINAAFCSYQCVSHAERAVESLLTASFSSDNLSILVQSRDHSGRPGKSALGCGGFATGTLGFLDGPCVFAIPGLGSLIAAGPFMYAMEKIGRNGASSGLTSILLALGIPEFESRQFTDCINQGGVLLSIRCNSYNHIDRAIEHLRRSGALHICSHTNAIEDQALQGVFETRL